MQSKKILTVSIWLICLLTCTSVFADATVKFHGTLEAGSCSADSVNVEFGTVQVDKISASTTTRSATTRSTDSGVENFSLTVNCTGSVSDLQFRLNGTASAFNSFALETDVSGLGVVVAPLGGNEITDTSGSTVANILPGTWYVLKNGAGTYSLTAILVKNTSATFTGGEFNATATLSLQIP